MAMNYKQLETMRQTRLFLTEVIIPLATAGALLANNESVRNLFHKKNHSTIHPKKFNNFVVRKER